MVLYIHCCVISKSDLASTLPGFGEKPFATQGLNYPTSKAVGKFYEYPAI
jgi:hypothetical protein